jgi:hypothetical protein
LDYLTGFQGIYAKKGSLDGFIHAVWQFWHIFQSGFPAVALLRLEV